MIKFYMYIIYRLHDFFSKKDTTPIGDTVLAMFVIHVFQLLTVFLYLLLFVDSNIKLPFIQKSPLFYLLCGLLAAIYYFVIFHNGKWKIWANQFKNEAADERKKNGIKVWLYCWGSMSLFFVSAIIIFYIR